MCVSVSVDVCKGERERVSECVSVSVRESVSVSVCKSFAIYASAVALYLSKYFSPPTQPGSFCSRLNRALSALKLTDLYHKASVSTWE